MYHPQSTPQPLSPHVGELFPFSVSCSPDTSRPEVEKCHESQKLSTYLSHHSFQIFK